MGKIMMEQQASKQAMAWLAPQKFAASQCSPLTLSEASSTLHLDNLH